MLNKYEKTSNDELRCPACSETNKNAEILFAHFIWKHPFEYLTLKRANISQRDMVIKWSDSRTIIFLCKKRNVPKTTPKFSDEMNEERVAKRTRLCEKNETRNVLKQSEKPLAHATDTNQSSVIQPLLSLKVPKNQFKCKWCNEIFESALELAQHDVKIHTNVKRFVCCECGFLLNSLNLLTDHLEVYHGGMTKDKVCATCNAHFSDSNVFQNHKCQEYLQQVVKFYLSNPLYHVL